MRQKRHRPAFQLTAFSQSHVLTKFECQQVSDSCQTFEIHQQIQNILRLLAYHGKQSHLKFVLAQNIRRSPPGTDQLLLIVSQWSIMVVAVSWWSIVIGPCRPFCPFWGHWVPLSVRAHLGPSGTIWTVDRTQSVTFDMVLLKYSHIQTNRHPNPSWKILRQIKIVTAM